MKPELRIPNDARRCIVLIASGEPTVTVQHINPLTKRARTMIRRAKPGIISLTNLLTERFGRPSVICGNDPTAMTTAATVGLYHKFQPNTCLDLGSSHSHNRARARRVLFHHTKDRQLVVAYGHHQILDKAVGAKNPTKTSLKPGVEAAVIFIDGKDKVLGTQKVNLLAAA